jgi:hypothetical protein
VQSGRSSSVILAAVQHHFAIDEAEAADSAFILTVKLG